MLVESRQAYGEAIRSAYEARRLEESKFYCVRFGVHMTYGKVTANE